MRFKSLSALESRLGADAIRRLKARRLPPRAPRPAPPPKPKRPLLPKGMNRLEARYASILMGRQMAGVIRGFAYERTALTLAFRCSLLVDFDVDMPDGTLVYVEVKGPYEFEDSRIKFKCASQIFPDRVFIWAKQKERGGQFRETAWRAGEPMKGWRWTA